MQDIRLFDKGEYKVLLHYLDNNTFYLDMVVLLDMGIAGKDMSQVIEICLPLLVRNEQFEPKPIKVNKIIAQKDFFHLNRDFSKNDIFIFKHKEFILPTELNLPYCWLAAVKEFKKEMMSHAISFKIEVNHCIFKIHTERVYDLLKSQMDNVVKGCMINRAITTQKDFLLPDYDNILKIKRNNYLEKEIIDHEQVTANKTKI